MLGAVGIGREIYYINDKFPKLLTKQKAPNLKP
jgi:hypothetical protein